MNGLRRQGLVDNVFESFGDLGSIFSLPGGDKMYCMACVGRGELRRVTTQGLLERGMVLGVKSGYGTGMGTSRE